MIVPYYYVSPDIIEHSFKLYNENRAMKLRKRPIVIRKTCRSLMTKVGWGFILGGCDPPTEMIHL